MEKIIIYHLTLGEYRSYEFGELYSGIDRFVGTVIHERHHVYQISEADKLVPTGTADTPWRYGWSFNKPLHNHYAVGTDGKPGRKDEDDDMDGEIDNHLVTGPGELGRGGSTLGKPNDDYLGTVGDPDWPAVWQVPAGGPVPVALERDAIYKTNDENQEHQNARNDWGNPGKNHQTIDHWND